MEFITQASQWVAENGDAVVAGILSIVGGASIIAKLTPTPKDDRFLAKIKAAIERIALNPKR